jgi:ABC-type glycerol-3-phosphate transport system substrate-binding protein
MMESVRMDCSMDGKLMAFPEQGDVVAYCYHKGLHKLAGATETPKTMEDALEVAKAAHEAIKDEGGFGFGMWTSLYSFVAALHQTYAPPERRFTEEGLINFEDEGFLASMDWCKRTLDAGICPKGWETAGNWAALWANNLLHSQITMHGNGSRGGMVFGFDKLAMMPLPLGNPEEVPEPGTMFWFTAAGLLKAAPRPQETVDWFCWAFGNENADMGNGVFKAGKLPAWYSIYEMYCNPDDVTKNWALVLQKALDKATPPPVTPWYRTEIAAFTPRFTAYMHGDMSAEQAITEIVQEVQDEMAKA